MITANLAGSAVSHLRPERMHRDSKSHSRQNLNEASECFDAEAAGYKRIQLTTADGTDVIARAGEAATNKRNYKAWAYMGCVGLVIVVSIILIILAASGILSTDDS